MNSVGIFFCLAGLTAAELSGRQAGNEDSQGLYDLKGAGPAESVAVSDKPDKFASFQVSEAGFCLPFLNFVLTRDGGPK